jgi:hypothetical protein
MKEWRREQLEQVEQFEGSIGLPNGFFRKLSKEDDWAFIIKAHALIESAIGYMLTRAIDENRLDKYIATLDLCGGRHSKVSLAEALDLLDADEKKFIKGLSSMRNRLVHNIRHITFDISTYVQSFSSEQLQEYLTTTAIYHFDAKAPAADKDRMKKWIVENPKVSLWYSLLHVVAMAAARAEIEELKKKMAVAECTKKKLESDLAKAQTLFRLTRDTSLQLTRSGLTAAPSDV